MSNDRHDSRGRLVEIVAMLDSDATELRQLDAPERSENVDSFEVVNLSARIGKSSFLFLP